MDPKKITFKKTAFCCRHARMCPIPDLDECLLVLGAPCVLFSRFLDLTTFENVLFSIFSMKDMKDAKRYLKRIRRILI